MSACFKYIIYAIMLTVLAETFQRQEGCFFFYALNETEIVTLTALINPIIFICLINYRGKEDPQWQR